MTENLELAKAKQLLQEEEANKIAAFIAEYQELCKKHGMQLMPQFNLIVQPIQNQN
jgi:hypothetical protein